MLVKKELKLQFSNYKSNFHVLDVGQRGLLLILLHIIPPTFPVVHLISEETELCAKQVVSKDRRLNQIPHPYIDSGHRRVLATAAQGLPVDAFANVIRPTDGWTCSLCFIIGDIKISHGDIGVCQERS